MGSGTGSQSFTRAWHFVDPADKDSKKTCRLHAMRETARRRKWQAEKDRLKAGRSNIVLARPLPLGRSNKLSSVRIDQTCDDGWESDNGGDSPEESSNKSRPTTPSQKKPEGRKSLNSRSVLKPLSPTKGSRHRQNSCQSIVPSASPKCILGTGRANPFDTYPVPNSDQKLDILTDSCKLHTQLST